MSDYDDVIDKMIERVSTRQAKIVPTEISDIDASDWKRADMATAQLRKRDGFPVIGAVVTENQEQAKKRRSERIRRLKKLAEQEEKEANE